MLREKYHSNFQSEKLTQWTFSRGRKKRGRSESAMRKKGTRENSKILQVLVWDPCTLYILWRLKWKQKGKT